MIGLSETSWNSFGKHVTGKGKNSLIYSGKGDEKQHSKGLGIPLTRAARKSLKEWQPALSRITYACFRTKIRNISTIQCYALTEQVKLEIKDEFFNSFIETLLEIKR
jgi:hypothetical protein